MKSHKGTVVLCSLALNEMEWLPKLYEQHKDWPGMLKWVFVEAADRSYANANPSLVDPAGLSVDGTTDFLAKLAQEDSRVVHIRHGFTDNADPAEAKCAARQRYLDECESVRPDKLFIIDADEFYVKDDQREIMEMMVEDNWYKTYCWQFIHIWRPLSMADQALFQHEVVRGFWGMSHARGFKWLRGMCYNNDHNLPSHSGVGYGNSITNYNQIRGTPSCIHMGHAAMQRTRQAKNAYYVQRGEATDKARAWYVESRAAYNTWKPGDVLPRRAKVLPYVGPVPECWPCRQSPNGMHEWEMVDVIEACRFCFIKRT